MGSIAKRFLSLYEEHRRKVAAIERETAAEMAELIAELEERLNPHPAPSAASASGSVATQEVTPLAQIETASGSKIALIQADITRLPVDAIVNPASRTLQGGGGIEGAILRAGGQGLVDECKELNGVERGEAKLTRGHKLPAKYVIHTVGPIWKGGDHDEAKMLADCYRHSLELATKNDVQSIAFPAISTGNFGYPIEEATRIAVKESAQFVSKHPELKVVYLVGFADDAIQAYMKAMKDVSG
ncbi:MAG: macro domain-containing protein [Verrucomicrobiota bacterium]